MEASIYVIFGMLNFLGKNSTVSDILSALNLEMYDLWHLQCSMDGQMYQTGSPCGTQYALYFEMF